MAGWPAQHLITLLVLSFSFHSPREEKSSTLSHTPAGQGEAGGVGESERIESDIISVLRGKFYLPFMPEALTRLSRVARDLHNRAQDLVVSLRVACGRYLGPRG